MKKRGFLVKLGLLIVLISGTCLFALEGGVRLYSAIAFPKMAILDEELGWRHASDVSKVFVIEDGTRALVVQGRHGHRGSQYDDLKVPGKQRVLFLGDSFTEGSQVNESELFTSIIEKSNPQLEIINTGVGGYGTVQEYLYLMKNGLQLHPDVVVLMVYENDFNDNCLSYTPSMGPRPYAQWNGGEVQVMGAHDWKGFERFGMPLPFQEWFHTHSLLYYFVDTRIYQVVRKEPLQVMWDETLKKLDEQDLRGAEGCRKQEIFGGIVRKMVTALHGVGSNLAIVAIPTRKDVAAGRSQVNSWVMKVCAEEGLRCLDLLSAFVRAASEGEKSYFDVDIHWTKKGHQVAAREILLFLNSFTKSEPLPLSQALP